MKYSISGIVILVSVGLGICNFTEAVCNVCQENNVACVNLTSYYMCYGAPKPNTNQLFTCPNGLVCTNLPNICFQRNTLPASCGDTSSCGICNANQVFACTSRTTFAFCFGATVPSDVVGTCPAGSTCDASNPDICVKALTPTSILCDVEKPIYLKELYEEEESEYDIEV